jgi:hypothetical protein
MVFHAVLNWNYKDLRMVYCNLKHISFRDNTRDMTFEEFVEENFNTFIEINRKSNWLKKLMAKERLQKI